MKFGAVILVAIGMFAIVHARAAEIVRSGDEDWAIISISGRIDHGDDEAFIALTSRIRHAMVMLDSNGGYLNPALRIGQSIRVKGYLTVALSKCLSACALVWLAGTERVMSPITTIGFHAAYHRKLDGSAEIDTRGVALMASYIARLGLRDDMVKMATVDPNQMEFLSKKRADDIGLSVTMLGEAAETAYVVR